MATFLRPCGARRPRSHAPRGAGNHRAHARRRRATRGVSARRQPQSQLDRIHLGGWWPGNPVGRGGRRSDFVADERARCRMRGFCGSPARRRPGKKLPRHHHQQHRERPTDMRGDVNASVGVSCSRPKNVSHVGPASFCGGLVPPARTFPRRPCDAAVLRQGVRADDPVFLWCRVVVGHEGGSRRRGRRGAAPRKFEFLCESCDPAESLLLLSQVDGTERCTWTWTLEKVYLLHLDFSPIFILVYGIPLF